MYNNCARYHTEMCIAIKVVMRIVLLPMYADVKCITFLHFTKVS